MKELHINVLELNVIWLGLQAFEDTLHDSNVAIMCDNVSAIAYLRNQGALGLNRCAAWPSIPVNGPKNGP